MGQACPRTAPSQHSTPTQCQGVLTTYKISTDDGKFQGSQFSMESKVISRGASCTQDDINHSFRKKKEKEKDTAAITPKPNHQAEKKQHCSTDFQQNGEHSLQEKILKTHRHRKQHDKYKHSDKLSAPNEKPQHDLGVTLKESRGHRHRQRRVKGHKENFDTTNRESEFVSKQSGKDALKADRYYMSHQTHEIMQKGSLLEIHVYETDCNRQQKRNYGDRQHHPHRQHHHCHNHRHRKGSPDKDNECIPDGTGMSKSMTQFECSTQNEHNTKIIARRAHPPNSQELTTAFSIRTSQRDKKNLPSSVRGSGRERKISKEKGDEKKSHRDVGAVYSIPPLLQ